MSRAAESVVDAQTGGSSRSATRERILEVAEKLFAERGISSVSSRAIMAEANVNIAAIHYHFGAKEQLVAEVFRHRAGLIAERRLAMLDAAMRLPVGRERLEAIVRAFVEPGILGGAKSREIAVRYAKFRAKLLADDTELGRQLMAESFDESSRAFVDALVETLPNLSREELHWRMHSMLGMMVYTMADSGRIASITEGACDTSDLTNAIEHIIEIAADVFMAGLPAAPKPLSQPRIDTVSGVTPQSAKTGEPLQMTDKLITRDDLREAAEKYKNWGKWGDDDEIGTLNYTSPEDIVAATRLVRKGKVISLGLNYDHLGPQGAKSKYPIMGRINPVHSMLRTGTDAYAGVLDHRGIRAADDMVVMPLQCGTQWDGLGHVFYENSMWNGYDCREVTSFGAQKCGIEKTKNKMVGRGVLLDVARLHGVDSLDDGYGITCEDLDKAAEAQGVEVRRGDFIIVRTGHMERCVAAGSWDGYPGGDAPGLAFETLEWIQDNEIAAMASDTWGCEVRPNRAEPGINQPWHWITIPIMGMTMGEIFNVAELGNDCAEDEVYEFLFVAPALPITGAVGSPTNPLAIK